MTSFRLDKSASALARLLKGEYDDIDPDVRRLLGWDKGEELEPKAPLEPSDPKSGSPKWRLSSANCSICGQSVQGLSFNEQVEHVRGHGSANKPKDEGPSNEREFKFNPNKDWENEEGMNPNPWDTWMDEGLNNALDGLEKAMHQPKLCRLGKHDPHTIEGKYLPGGKDKTVCMRCKKTLNSEKYATVSKAGPEEDPQKMMQQLEQMAEQMPKWHRHEGVGNWHPISREHKNPALHTRLAERRQPKRPALKPDVATDRDVGRIPPKQLPAEERHHALPMEGIRYPAVQQLSPMTPNPKKPPMGIIGRQAVMTPHLAEHNALIESVYGREHSFSSLRETAKLVEDALIHEQDPFHRRDLEHARNDLHRWIGERQPDQTVTPTGPFEYTEDEDSPGVWVPERA